MANFQPLEVVGRGSETQLQVGENFKKSPCGMRVTLRVGGSDRFRRHLIFYPGDNPGSGPAVSWTNTDVRRGDARRGEEG